MTQGSIQKIREEKPLIHCITNYVTAGDCANALLAIGASPIMADAPEEAGEIAGRCRALVLNLGTLSKNRLSSMLVAGKISAERGIPAVLDPVGAGASRFRLEAARQLIEVVKPAVIRGNISEILALSGSEVHSGGVDAGEKDAPASLEARRDLAAAFARQSGAVTVITGAVDVVSDGERTADIQNGHPMMGRITGAGCILSALMGAFLTVSSKGVMESAVNAVGTFGLCGERAYAQAAHLGGGTGSFRIALFDQLSLVRDEKMGGIRFGM